MTWPSSTLFVYGSLLFDEVVRALTHRTFQSTAAVLNGYSRRSIMGKDDPLPYPAIRPAPSDCVRGRILLDVDEGSARSIDRFESDPPDYQVTRVTVVVPGNRSIPATAYVACPHLLPRLRGAWDAELFRRCHLPHYLTQVIPGMDPCQER
jgi:gamma-glutamylcyclotransferase (GGCT)/AIG2-like uncharacterized protein YtfP